MKRRLWLAVLGFLLAAQVSAWLLAGRDRLEEAVLDDLVASFVRGLRAEGAQGADHLFVCAELARGAGSKAVADVKRQLSEVDVGLVVTGELELWVATPETDRQYSSLCATATTNNPIVAVLDVADGYGSRPGYGYRRRQAYLHILGCWWPIWQWGDRRTVF